MVRYFSFIPRIVFLDTELTHLFKKFVQLIAPIEMNRHDIDFFTEVVELEARDSRFSHLKLCPDERWSIRVEPVADLRCIIKLVGLSFEYNFIELETVEFAVEVF